MLKGKNNNGTGGWFDIVCLRVGFWPTIVDMGAPVDLLPWFNEAAYCV